ncbi:MAG: hypothetical protein AAF570_14415 [Bacteroidota bacterium]
MGHFVFFTAFRNGLHPPTPHPQQFIHGIHTIQPDNGARLGIFPKFDYRRHRTILKFVLQKYMKRRVCLPVSGDFIGPAFGGGNEAFSAQVRDCADFSNRKGQYGMAKFKRAGTALHKIANSN